MHLPHGGALNLPRFVETITGEEGIDPPLADSLVAALDEDLRDVMTGEEDRELRRIMRERHWLAEDGSWQPIRLLAFPQSGDTAECARAAFAPPSGRLAPGYSTDGFELAEFAREQAGQNETVWQGWAETANSCATRQTGFIRYLVDADQRTVTLFSLAATWLPDAAHLAQSPLLEGLTPDERGRLLAKLGLYQSFPPVEIGSLPELQLDAGSALIGIADWWRENRDVLCLAYDRAVYPEDFSPVALGEGDDTAWFTMLALASFHTLGRTRPGQSREFVTRAMQDGWWRKLARTDPNDNELRPFIERLRAWSGPDAEESYLQWRRCLTDLCMISRHLDSYRRLFTKLPAIVAKEGEVSLHNHLRPSFSQVAARMGVQAAPLARSLGIGANWLIRELSRHGVYSLEQADLIRSYGWSTTERVRRLFLALHLGKFEHGVDQGRLLHERVHDLIGDEVRFCGDGDLPLHVITLSKHRDELNSILYDTDVGEWPDEGWDDLNDDDA